MTETLLTLLVLIELARLALQYQSRELCRQHLCLHTPFCSRRVRKSSSQRLLCLLFP
nr:MAG TPA: hypothetical protein [Caudoviricetes sp.]